VQGGDGGQQSPCDVVIDAGVVVTDEQSNEGVAKDGAEVPTESKKVSVFLDNFKARDECCVSDDGAECNGFEPWVDYPIGGCCVDDGFQCTDDVYV